MYGCERPEIKKEIKGKIEPPKKLLHNIYAVDFFPCSIFLAIWFFLNDFISLLRRVFSSKEYDY